MTAYVRWFQRLAKDSNGVSIPAGDESGLKLDEVVTPPNATGAAPDWAQFVEIHVSSAYHYTVAESPTATSSNMRLAADSTVFKGVKGGLKIHFTA